MTVLTIRPTWARRIAIATALAFMVTGTLTSCSSSSTSDAGSSPQRQPSGGSAELSGAGLPPWPAPADVPARVARAGLDLGPMGMAEHYHPQLQITINGEEAPVAPGIGVDLNTGAMSAVHTHEGDGTIHIEASKAGEAFTLGQVFTQWGVRLTNTQIGGVRVKARQKVTVTSNGTSVTGDPMKLRLEPNSKMKGDWAGGSLRRSRRV
jgi:hypothetical protein